MRVRKKHLVPDLVSSREGGRFRVSLTVLGESIERVHGGLRRGKVKLI